MSYNKDELCKEERGNLYVTKKTKSGAGLIEMRIQMYGMSENLGVSKWKGPWRKLNAESEGGLSC